MEMPSSDHIRLYLSLSHFRGKINTSQQRARTSVRMKENNPSKNIRDGSGKYIKEVHK